MSYVVTSPKLENGAKLVGYGVENDHVPVLMLYCIRISTTVSKLGVAEGAVSTLDKVIPRGESSRTSSRQCDCSAGR